MEVLKIAAKATTSPLLLYALYQYIRKVLGTLSCDIIDIAVEFEVVVEANPTQKRHLQALLEDHWDVRITSVDHER